MAAVAPRVWNQRDPRVPPGAIYVGRPTIWGNPFKIGRDAQGVYWTRDQVVDLFEDWILTNHRELIRLAQRELRGKHLVCWCYPDRCHASFWLLVANAAA